MTRHCVPRPSALNDNADVAPHPIWRRDLASTRLQPFSGSGRKDLVDAVHSEAALGQPSGLSGDERQLYVAGAAASPSGLRHLSL